MAKIQKILAVTGIRSEYDILYPVIKYLNEREEFDVSVAVSGAHLSKWHNHTIDRIISDGFKIADRIDSLLATDRDAQRSKGVGQLIIGLTQTVEREKPDLLIFVGDREESIATAVVGNYMQVLVAHIGGGDPVWGNSDDPIRGAASKLCHIHFTTAKPYSDNLISFGEDPWRIQFCGTPGLDNIRNEPEIPFTRITEFLDDELEDYLVVINHPLSSEKDDVFNEITTLLTSLESFCAAKGMKAVIIEPNSDPGSYEIVRAYEAFDGENLIFVNTLPRDIFVNLMRNAKVLVGNSSMGILEAPMHKLPVVNVGNRQQGRLNAGNVHFVDFKESDIMQALERAVFDDVYRRKVAELENPYGEGKASQIIANFIKDIDPTDPKWLVKQKLF